MKSISALLILIVAAMAETGSRAADAGEKPQLEIIRATAESVIAGSPENMTGKTQIRRFNRPPPARVNGAIVTFERGARTAWHSHPLGQTLIVTEGCGWVQIEGGAKVAIGPGDIVWTPAGAKHWHGASADSAMTHVAIVEAIDGKNVEWMEHVSDQQYGSRESSTCKTPKT